MMRWPAEQQPLAPFFDPEVGSGGGGYIPCGVCSVRTSMTNWAVCPRRLLSFDAAQPSEEQLPLRNRVLQLAGFGNGDTVRVWSEITLRDSTGLNYRLDYVLRSGDSPPVIVEVMTASTSGGNKSKRTDMQSAFCDAEGVSKANVWGYGHTLPSLKLTSRPYCAEAIHIGSDP